ncbi:MAG: hypothetical protein FJW20_00355 [Acidimicrobiia bacterium]|nr:hypothetical protein [Acidimicrobiia bacterium]
MKDSITAIEHYTLGIEDKPGAAAMVLNALAAGGVNMIGFWGYPMGPGRGQLEIIPEDAAKLRAAAKKAKLPIQRTHKAYLVQGKDRVGAVAAALGKLGDAGINVHAAQAVCGGAGRYGALIYVAEDDVKKAGKILLGK